MRRYPFTAMGCPCELRFCTDTAAVFHAAVERCVGEVRRFERKYSQYLPDSVTTAINRAAGREPIPIDRETAAILQYAQACHEQSEGLFDITSGVFRHVWRPRRTTVPSQKELDACAAKVGWDKVRYSDERVYLPQAGMELDFGGVIKEYAADAAAMLARKAGIRQGLVNLGGDICIVGPQAKGRPWPIGIAHPRRSGSAIATVSLAEGALATSGGYERFVEIGGRRYSHLIDPRTGWPVEGLLSVSVVASQAIVAGSVATIASLQRPDEALAWLERCATPYLAIDAQLRCHGHLLIHQEEGRQGKSGAPSSPGERGVAPSVKGGWGDLPFRRRRRSLRCC